MLSRRRNKNADMRQSNYDSYRINDREYMVNALIEILTLIDIDHLEEARVRFWISW